MDTQTTPQPSKAPKLLHIFKPGRRITAAGEEIVFTEADLEATARAYDPKLHKAPLVKGHPKTDDPAQGWAKALAAKPNGLYAEPMKVDAEFADSVNAGRYGTISSKFYRPTDPNNPVPGVWYLRHIGFLGAEPPSVKGMDEPEFSEEDDGCVCFTEAVEFSAWSDTQAAAIFRRLRDWLIGKEGLDEADKVIPDYAVASLEDEARQERDEQSGRLGPAFSDPPTTQENETVKPEEAAALQAKNTELQNKLAALESKASKDAQEKRHAEHVTFAEGLVGKLKEDQRGVVVATLDLLAGQETPVEFGEGENKQPLVNAFKGLFSDLPDLVEFGEVATKGKAAGGGAADVEFSAPSGYFVDPQRLALHNKAQAHAAEHKVSYEQALKAVS